MPCLIVFSHLRWNFVYQRPQHLLSRLARHYRVLFIEEPIHAEGPPSLDRSSPLPNLEVWVPRTPLGAWGFDDSQVPLIEPMLSAELQRQGIDDYVLWFYTPMALPITAQWRPRAVVYDCMDELSAFKGAPPQLRQREAALLKAAHIVFTGGPALYASKRRLHDNVHCLPSSVDAAHFNPAGLSADGEAAREAASAQDALPHPRLGFFGVIDERLDIGLLDSLAEARPDWQIVMVGPVVKIDPAQLPRRANLHWLGMRSYDCLPYLMAQWDVCLMPFALNDATRFISPTKTLEYMAGGKSVVSTAVGDVVGLYSEVVDIAYDAEGFIAACAAVLAQTRHERERRHAAMAQIVAGSSWDRSAETVRRLLHGALNRQPETARQRSRGGLIGVSPAEGLSAA